MNRKFLEYVSKLSRQKKTALQLALDAILLTVTFLGAMIFRFESLDFVVDLNLWKACFSSVLAGLFVFWRLGLYNVIIRFLTGKVLIIIGEGALITAVSLYPAGLAFDANLPSSVPFVFAVLAFLSIGGMRFVARSFFRNYDNLNKRPVIIYGAGKAGLQLLNALFHSNEFAPVAIVDDDRSFHNLSVGGLQVYLPEKISHLVQTMGVQVILLAVPNMSRDRRRQIVNSLADLGLVIKTIPAMADIISGRNKISNLQTVSAEDLLGRDPVLPDPALIGLDITGRVVMVSGAGGSIGSELCRQILLQKPSHLILFEVSELALYAIATELTEEATRLQFETRVLPILGSVQNSRRLETVIKAFQVDTIYHAAAYKHVPLVEENMIEGIHNNVFGTLEITNAAKKFGVKKFVLISTDKAVRSTNVMGASKRIAELICQAQGQEANGTIFSMVRFGNVLGSSGSVIPRFRAQIEAGGPVTVTHKDITRYFMTIPEAAQLVIQAGAMAKGGDVFVLDMGEPVKIIDLAYTMIKLHGLRPFTVNDANQIVPREGDIPIHLTGLRKGEKLFEELLISNSPEETKHPRIKTASEVCLPYDVLISALSRLRMACSDFDCSTIVSILCELPLGYAPQDEDIPDLIWNLEQDNEERQGAKISEDDSI